MNTKMGWLILLFAAGCACQVWADEPVYRILPAVEHVTFLQKDAGKEQPKVPDPKKQVPDKKGPLPFDPFAEPAPERSDLTTGFRPSMLGDFFGYLAFQQTTVTGTQTTTTVTQPGRPKNGVPQKATTVTTTKSVSANRNVLVPVASAGIFKVAENESPLPQDRVFFIYNYFGGLTGPPVGPNPPIVSSQSDTVRLPGMTTTTTNSIFLPPAPIVNGTLQRQILGVEKTFLDGYASVELRLPLLQQSGDLPGFGAQFVGDMTIVTKYAFYLDRETSDVLSGGLALTVPTGPGIPTSQGTLHSTYFQPWGGYIYNFGRMFYLQGFHSVVVPTDRRDLTLLFNDLGLNFWLYRGSPDRFLRSIVPTCECHITTPLTHRDGTGAVYAPDLVIMTGGVHFGLFRGTTMSFGVATPVTGPRIFGVEGFAQLNWRF